MAAAAAAAGGGAARLGGRTGRHYAVAISAAVMIVGLDLAYELPLYAYLSGILLAPFMYHRGVRSRLTAAAAALAPIELPELGIRLRRTADKDPRRIGVWSAERLEDRAAAGEVPIVALPAGLQVLAPGTEPASLVLTLEFEGELDDDYQIALSGEASRPVAGKLALLHRQSVGHFTEIFEEYPEVDNLPGMEPWMLIRSEPADFAFQLLDPNGLQTLHALFSLQSEERQMYTVIDGKDIHVVATRTFDAEELKTLLAAGARWIQKVRQIQ
ncbi:MAG: hypothetical protein HY554_08675 [Elusimicrobia bacterium]|nr:hypothetical protein [Elusimicrobiota bacterium]